MTRGIRPSKGLLWTVLSLVLFVAAAFGFFPARFVVRLVVETTHSFDMALWSGAWALLAAFGVLVAARIVFGAWPQVGGPPLALLTIGTVLSMGAHVTLQSWAAAWFGYYDPDFIGWTAALFAILVGVATAAFGVFVAPRGTAAWPLAFVLLGSAGVAFVLASNLPGLADGLGADSWLLAAWLGASGLYAAAATAACFIQAREPGATRGQDRAIP